MRTHFILYVADQDRSTSFYSHALGLSPTLDVPGMTEFSLGAHTVLGLMPEAGAARLLGKAVQVSGECEPCSRTELYLVVDDAAAWHQRALEAGGREISPLADRDWAHRTAYSLDPDGHILAFAEDINS